MAKRIKPHTEEESRAELASTEVSPATARFMTWAFVTIIWTVPLLQLGAELHRGETPQVVRLFEPIKEALGSARAGNWRAAFDSAKTMFTVRHLRDFDSAVERGSILKSYFQPRVQLALTRHLGFGNDKGVVGRDGWLFYQPGLDYLVGPSIVDRAHLWVRAKKMVDKQTESDPHPDPRPAILDFQRRCAERGIHLILLPVPDKAMLQPDEITWRLASGSAAVRPNNRGYQDFVAELKRNGVDVFEPVSHLEPHKPRYLLRDTHWTPEFMDEVAAGLADHIRRKRGTDPALTRRMALAAESVSHYGDLVQMLQLPADQSVFPKQTVQIERVLDADTGEPWRPDQDSDILLLGDSFANIYSNSSLGWGSSAGLSEHVSYHLRQPIDVITMNGSGASGTRLELARRENSERLSKKKLIVWEFAVRDLATQSWKPAALPPPVAVARRITPAPVILPAVDRGAMVAPQTIASEIASPKTPPASHLSTPAEDRKTSPGAESSKTPAPLTVMGHVVKVSRVPQPFSAPYGDCLTAIKIEIERVESGAYPDHELLAVFWGMKDNKWLPAASYTSGQRLRLKLVLFKEAEDRIRSVQRVDELDDYDHLPYFVIAEEKQ